MDKITIIIPVRNGENYLKEAIESALQQDYENKEVIVVNDGSSDRTRTIIEEFGEQISSLEQENKGVSSARNRGVERATGTYLSFLDHDDLWEKTKLSQQMKLLLQKGDDPLVFCQMKQFFCSSLEEEERRKISLNQDILPGYIPGALLLSQERFDQIGPFLETHDLGEFIEWYARAVDLSIPVAMLEKLGLYRRVHQTNMGRQRELYPRSTYLKTLKLCLDRRRVSYDAVL